MEEIHQRLNFWLFFKYNTILPDAKSSISQHSPYGTVLAIKNINYFLATGQGSQSQDLRDGLSH